MKIKLDIPKFGMILALLLIAYQNISAITWQYSSNNTTIISLAMLFVALIAVYLVIYKPISRNSIETSLLGYYLYILLVCLINGYVQVFVQEPTILFTSVYWIFCFIVFKETAKRGLLSAKAFSIIFFMLTVICFVLLCRYYTTNKSQEISLSGLNVVYYLLFMLPILLMSNDKKVVTIGVILNLIAILLSSKRGALVAIIIALIIWKRADLNNQMSKKLSTKKLLKIFSLIVFCIVAVCIALTIVKKMNLNILQRMKSLLTGDDSDGSGRTKIWDVYWEYMKTDSLWNNLIGRGYISTKRNPSLRTLGMNWAHNDFLQILFDYGIIGLAIFGSIIVKLFLTARKMKRAQHRYYAPFLASLIIFLLCCCFSMVTLLPQWFMTMAAFWGFVIGDFEQERMRI